MIVLGEKALRPKSTPGELALLPALPHCLSAPPAHLMRTLSHRKKRVRVNVTSWAAAPLRAQVLVAAVARVLEQAAEKPAAAVATD
jgi:hypothetical protein